MSTDDIVPSGDKGGPQLTKADVQGHLADSHINAPSNGSAQTSSSISTTMNGPHTITYLEPVCFSSYSRRWDRALPAATATSSFVSLVTWNIDFTAPNTSERLNALLSFLQNILSPYDGIPGPCCILLQEVSADAFPTLLAHSWVRQHFTAIPSSPRHWPHGATYGNVTLVCRTIPVISAHSLVFGNSSMGRNALIVDILLLDTRTEHNYVVRIANTHLESLTRGAPARPEQLGVIGDALMVAGINAGVVGGDMNIISAEDAHMHERIGLHDAYQGRERKAGHTWGYQPPSRFPAGRLDRIFYIDDGNCRVQVEHPERLGVGLQTHSGQWLSDHFGLLTTVRVKAHL